MGGDMVGIMEYAGNLLTHVHVADSFDHRASSGLRYIVNPSGSTCRVHQHMDIGQGEVNWQDFFDTLGRLRFDGIMTVCVFGWEERARESSIFMREEITRYISGWPTLGPR
jgi:myo-inositol catabolism protein IolH